MYDHERFSQTRSNRLHNAMLSHVECGRLPGLVALVHRRGREQLETLGTLAFDSAAPMQRDTIFRLASMTKPITAVGAMILVEECKLRLDDPVDSWLPELKDRQVLRTIDGPLDDTLPAKRSITLRDLLTFRSGYGEVGLPSPICPLQQALTAARLPLSEWLFFSTPDEFMKRLGSLPLAHQPGERWLYHMGCEILGVLIARVCGQSLGDFLKERIFDPLGMRDTGFHIPENKLDRLSTCYRNESIDGKAVVLDPAHDGLFAKPPTFESGAGGLVSTVDDMLAFGQMMLNKRSRGQEPVLSRSSIELMTMDHIAKEEKTASPFLANYWDTRGWGLGFGIITKRHDLADSPGRFGWDGAFGTSWYVDPKEELVGILMTQRNPEFLKIPAVVQDFWTSAYQWLEN